MTLYAAIYHSDNGLWGILPDGTKQLIADAPDSSTIRTTWIEYPQENGPVLFDLLKWSVVTDE